VIYALSAMTLGLVMLVVADAVGVPSEVIGTVLLLGPPFYAYRQLRGAYLLTRTGALVRTGILMIMAMVALTIFAVLLLALGTMG